MSGAAAILRKCCCTDGGLGCHYAAQNCDNPADVRSITCDSHPEGDTRPTGSVSDFVFQAGTTGVCFTVPAGTVPVPVTSLETVEVGTTFASCAACNAVADCGDCPTSYTVTASGIDLDDSLGDPLCTIGFTHVVSHVGGTTCAWRWDRTPGGWSQCDELSVIVSTQTPPFSEFSVLDIAVCGTFGGCQVGGSYCNMVLRYRVSDANTGNGFCPYLGTYTYEATIYEGSCAFAPTVADAGTVTVS